jgi:hypothetical protein
VVGNGEAAHGLPADVLLCVLRHLDHDALFGAFQVCKAWRALAAAPGADELWARQWRLRGWGPPHRSVAEAGAGPALEAVQPGQRHRKQQQQVDWAAAYRRQYQRCCYDCFRPTDRRTLSAGTLRVRLCQPCSLSYVSPQPHHRLLAATEAKRRCCIRDQGERAASDVSSAERPALPERWGLPACHNADGTRDSVVCRLSVMQIWRRCCTAWRPTL